MKVNVCFSWCDYFFQWTIDRKLPVLPSKGDCLSIIQPGEDSFVDEKDNERYKNIRMKGCGNRVRSANFGSRLQDGLHK